MNIKSVELLHAIIIPGTRISGDMTINPSKQPGTTFEVEGQFLIVSSAGKKAAIPFSCVKVMLIE